jgi:acyl-CoA synthetase (AMP-forming)/AMP-acid ligase II
MTTTGKIQRKKLREAERAKLAVANAGATSTR